MELSPEPPPRPRLGGKGPAVLALVGFLLALATFAVVLVMLRVLPSPVPMSAGEVTPSLAPTPSKSPKSARFAKQGECVLNQGTDASPSMILVTCMKDALVVLERLEGTVDISRCQKVDGYRYHYYYDHDSGDKLDFVLCMRKWT